MTKERCDISGAEWEKKTKWEVVDEAEYIITERLSVPGGWLYYVGHEKLRQMQVCFVPEVPDERM